MGDCDSMSDDAYHQKGFLNKIIQIAFLNNEI